MEAQGNKKWMQDALTLSIYSTTQQRTKHYVKDPRESASYEDYVRVAFFNAYEQERRQKEKEMNAGQIKSKNI